MLGGGFDSLGVRRSPLLEIVGNILDFVPASRWRSLSGETRIEFRVHLLLAFENRRGVATAVRVPPCKLERLRVFPRQLVANVVELMVLPVTSFEGMVAGKMHLYTDHEVHLLPPQVVGCVVCNVRLGGGKAQSVLVA